PVTGESTHWTPFPCTRWANLVVADGEIVLESAMITPSVNDCSTPSAPNTTLSTAAVSETQSHTTSAPCAASAGEVAGRAPSTTFPGVRFQNETSCPAFTRFVAIAWPMIPN